MDKQQVTQNASFAAVVEQKVLDYWNAQGFGDTWVQDDADGTSPETAAQMPTLWVAVSGGADSMALLRILLALQPKLRVKLAACHVNHCLRGAASDADQAFVEAELANLGVPLRVYSAFVSGHVPPQSAGEAWARDLRYGFFEELLAQRNAFVATAHTLNDQAETLLFRLARGTGLHGAAAIRPRRAGYLRPLLCLSRAEVERYCAQIGQDYVTDETNFQPQYARNRLRQDALPALCEVNEAAIAHLGQFCEKVATVDAYISRAATALLAQAQVPSQGDGLLCWSLPLLKQADPVLLEAAMHQLVCPIRDAEQKYVVALCQIVRKASGAVQIVEQVRFAVVGDFLCQQRQSPLELPQNVVYDPVCMGEYTFPHGYRVILEQISPQNMEKIQLVHKKDLKNYADYDKIVASIVLRTRQPGDTFTAAGRGCTKTLKKLYNEQGLSPMERQFLPLLAKGREVVWIWGQGFAEGYAPTAQTTRVLKITEEKILEE